MRKKASQVYYEPAGSFLITVALIAGVGAAAWYYGNSQGAAQVVNGLGFRTSRGSPWWNFDGTVNPVSSLYSGNQLFNQWYGPR